jgi:hypothetical protein
MTEILDALETVRDYFRDEKNDPYFSGRLGVELDKAREAVSLGDLSKVEAVFAKSRELSGVDLPGFSDISVSAKKFYKTFYEEARKDGIPDPDRYVFQFKTGDKAWITGSDGSGLNPDYPVEVYRGEPDEDGEIYVSGISKATGQKLYEYIFPSSLTYIPEDSEPESDEPLKVGDRVKVTGNLRFAYHSEDRDEDYWFFKRGDTGELTEIDSNGDARVLFDHDKEYAGRIALSSLSREG